MLLKKTDELAKNLKTSIDHLQSLEIECQWYFSELKMEDAFSWNQFSTSLAIANILDEVQDQFRDLRNDSSAQHDIIREMLFSLFWWAERE